MLNFLLLPPRSTTTSLFSTLLLDERLLGDDVDKEAVGLVGVLSLGIRLSLIGLVLTVVCGLEDEDDEEEVQKRLDWLEDEQERLLTAEFLGLVGIDELGRVRRVEEGDGEVEGDEEREEEDKEWFSLAPELVTGEAVIARCLCSMPSTI